MACALGVVAGQLREGFEGFFAEEGENTMEYPRIRKNEEEDSYEIVLEGLVICRCGDLVSAFALVMASNYIFNLA